MNDSVYVKEIQEKLSEWIAQWVVFNNEEAYDEKHLLTIYAIKQALYLLIEQDVFSSPMAIKYSFGKKYGIILPDSLFFLSEHDEL
jgi:hypothetical protein